jgi:hypothetical protein
MLPRENVVTRQFTRNRKRLCLHLRVKFVTKNYVRICVRNYGYIISDMPVIMLTRKLNKPYDVKTLELFYIPGTSENFIAVHR